MISDRDYDSSSSPCKQIFTTQNATLVRTAGENLDANLTNACDFRTYSHRAVEDAASATNVSSSENPNKRRCGRCGDEVTVDRRCCSVLKCGLHILCDACTHFQAGPRCAICVKDDSADFDSNCNQDELPNLAQTSFPIFNSNDSDIASILTARTDAASAVERRGSERDARRSKLFNFDSGDRSVALSVNTSSSKLNISPIASHWPSPRYDALPNRSEIPNAANISLNDNYLKDVFASNLSLDMLPQKNFESNGPFSPIQRLPNCPINFRNVASLRQTPNDISLSLRRFEMADPLASSSAQHSLSHQRDSPRLPHISNPRQLFAAPQPGQLFSPSLPPPPLKPRIVGHSAGFGYVNSVPSEGSSTGILRPSGCFPFVGGSVRPLNSGGLETHNGSNVPSYAVGVDHDIKQCSGSYNVRAMKQGRVSSVASQQNELGNYRQDAAAYFDRPQQDCKSLHQNFNVFTPPSPLNLSPASNLTPNNGQSMKHTETNLSCNAFNVTMFERYPSVPHDQNLAPTPSHRASLAPVVDSFCQICGRFVARSSHARDHRVGGASRRDALNAALARLQRLSDDLLRLCAQIDLETRAIDARSCEVRRNLSARCAEMVAAVNKRERQLLDMEHVIHGQKLSALNEQREATLRLREELANEVASGARDDEWRVLETGNDVSNADPISDAIWLKWRHHFEALFCRIQTVLSEPLAEDDRMWFVPGVTGSNNHSFLSLGTAASLQGSAPANSFDEGSGLTRALLSFGCFVTGASADQSKLIGEYVRRAVKCKPVVYNVQTRGYFGEPCMFGNDKVNILMKTPLGTSKEGHVIDRKNGTYQCTVTPDIEGNHMVYICVRNKNISGSPFSLMVRQGRDYGALGARPLFSFGGEGQSDGQLYRPWGVACDKLGRILVSDRGNNRVQIFDQCGTFLTKFGKEGGREGEFRKPAGLAVNSNNEIIVVDKDNHRVQVFTHEGKFLFAFGEEGLLCGQFNYPWDCAVNNAGSIAVSDTRNHRIQLFDGKGSFIRKFQFDLGEPRRSLHPNKGQASTPRGLVFAQDGRLLVTDFNHHRLVVIYPDTSEQPRAFGCLGAGNFQFNRPQGIEVDLDGAVLVCDGKNNRCQVFSPQLEFLGSFGVHDADRSPIMKTPCDLCVTPEERVFVVDFDNCMIRVF